MKFEAKLVEKLSKDGNKYYVFEIKITEGYSKQVFLDKADLEIIRLINATTK